MPPPDSVSVHDDLLATIAAHVFGPSAAGWRAEHIPSDESHVYELAADRHAPRIVKFERSDRWVVRREQQAFPALRARGFTEFPEVECTQADVDGTADASGDGDATAFMVMPKTEWRPYDEIWRSDQNAAFRIVERVGDFMRRLAVVPWQEIPGVITPEQREDRGWFERWLAPLGPEYPGVDVVLGALTTHPNGFGGWQFAQVLTDGHDTFTAIDWGGIGAFWPLNDLAAAILDLGDFDGERSRTLLEPVLLDAYTGGAGLSADDAAELEVWQTLWSLFFQAAALHRS